MEEFWFTDKEEQDRKYLELNAQGKNAKKLELTAAQVRALPYFYFLRRRLGTSLIIYGIRIKDGEESRDMKNEIKIPDEVDMPYRLEDYMEGLRLSEPDKKAHRMAYGRREYERLNPHPPEQVEKMDRISHIMS